MPRKEPVDEDFIASEKPHVVAVQDGLQRGAEVRVVIDLAEEVLQLRAQLLCRVPVLAASAGAMEAAW